MTEWHPNPSISSTPLGGLEPVTHKPQCDRSWVSSRHKTCPWSLWNHQNGRSCTAQWWDSTLIHRYYVCSSLQATALPTLGRTAKQWKVWENNHCKGSGGDQYRADRSRVFSTLTPPPPAPMTKEEYEEHGSSIMQADAKVFDICAPAARQPSSDPNGHIYTSDGKTFVQYSY